MYPGHWAQVSPDRPALIMAGSGETITYAELNDRSNRLAQLLHAAGLRPGDKLALYMENQARYLEVVWAALRSGLRLTTVNRYLTAEEAAYIVDDSDAKAFITSAALTDEAAAIPPLIPRCGVRLMTDGTVAGLDSYEEAVAAYPAEPLADEPLGDFLLYSSGTTGRPKGIDRPRPQGAKVADGLPVALFLGRLFGFAEGMVYLSPAPLYHSAPVAFTTASQSVGGTAVVLEHFDPVLALDALERYHVTHSQWVPTMFSRMLKLPAEQREGRDLSAHRMAVHAAAPCPRAVKEAMFDWWGPIIHEYYGGTELNGFTYVGPEDWLAHPGTVGRPVFGVIHICDEDGKELPVGEAGTVYFENPTVPFEYHKDPDRTRQSQHPEHPNWSALGDVGRLDEDGFLYLTDRATFMIVSGGVNIYPQEIEDCIAGHPDVDDVAVFGVPDEEMGEAVKAVVQPRPGAEAGPGLEASVLAFARDRIARYKCPRSVDFVEALPRLPTGKLYKRALRDQYWEGKESRIV